MRCWKPARAARWGSVALGCRDSTEVGGLNSSLRGVERGLAVDTLPLEMPCAENSRLRALSVSKITSCDVPVRHTGQKNGRGPTHVWGPFFFRASSRPYFQSRESTSRFRASRASVMARQTIRCAPTSRHESEPKQLALRTAFCLKVKGRERHELVETNMVRALVYRRDWVWRRRNRFGIDQ